MEYPRLIIRYISDVHTEFGNSPEISPCDVLILAGDIGTHRNKRLLIKFLKYSSTIASHIVYVLGNHDYYGSSIDTYVDNIKEIIHNNNLLNIHVLELDTLTIPIGNRQVTFFGCTLWSYITNHEFIQYNMNDYTKIRGPSYNRLTTRYLNSIHKTAVTWLDNALNDSHADIKIVVTHHMPHLLNNDSGPYDPYESAYRSDLSMIMDKHKVPLWIYGHTHQASDIIICGCRCVSNPLGYPDESTGYLPDAYIELS